MQSLFGGGKREALLVYTLFVMLAISSVAIVLFKEYTYSLPLLSFLSLFDDAQIIMVAFAVLAMDWSAGKSTREINEFGKELMPLVNVLEAASLSVGGPSRHDLPSVAEQLKEIEKGDSDKGIK